MHYVYILIDAKRNIYIGRTSDLKRRIKEHNLQKVYTTKRMQNPILYYYEAYFNELFAKERERKLKQFGSSYVGLIKRIGLK
jgi:predicted GIY-YIG superfamily endonuclease